MTFSVQQRRLLLGFLAGSFVTGGAGYWLTTITSAPQTFDDCVLRYVRPGLTDHASSLVLLSCRQKFPEVQEVQETTPIRRQIPAPQPGQSAPLIVTFDFTQECWVELVVDDLRRMSELHAPGESLRIEAERSVLLANVGNAQGVEVTVNGAPYPLHADGRIVREVRIELAPEAR